MKRIKLYVYLSAFLLIANVSVVCAEKTIVIGDILETTVCDSTLEFPTYPYLFRYKMSAKMKIRYVIEGSLKDKTVSFSFMSGKSKPVFLRYNHVMCLLEESESGLVANDFFEFVDVYETVDGNWVTGVFAGDCFLWNTVQMESKKGITLKEGESIPFDILEERYDYVSLSPNKPRSLDYYYSTSGTQSIPKVVLPAHTVAAILKERALPSGENKFDPRKNAAANNKKHKAIDLGLSVKWAECNIDASNAENYGGYYAWGETSQKATYYPDNYKDDSENVKDVASLLWGKNWRLPTKEELQELIDNCLFKEKELNGIKGVMATSKLNGNSIFLPLAGFWGANRHLGYGLNSVHSCYYMSSDIIGGNRNEAYGLFLEEGREPRIISEPLFLGISVRPVQCY